MKFYTSMLFISLIGCNTAIKYPDGGYDYPKSVEDKDTNFYFYPLKDTEPKKDSFRDALAYRFFNAFDEKNLSLKPRDKVIFRFVYEGWQQLPVIITLTDGKIIVKKGDRSDIYENYQDETKLTELERQHLNLLNRRFPIDTVNQKPFLKIYLDSMTKLYPQLLDPKYYLKLIDKAIIPNKDPFTYTTKTISLSKEKFQDLVNSINSSGYWSSPYELKCEYPPTDGYGFVLEANTKKKYNIVSAGGCPDDTTKFTRACQKLIYFAQMDKEINLVWKGTVIIDSADLPDVHEK